MRFTINRFPYFATLALLLCVFPATLAQNPEPAQTPAPQRQDGQDTEVVTIREVRLPVTVLDGKNPVSGMKKEDFLIYEDKNLQEIRGFSDETSGGQPVYVAVLMDTSGSVAGKLKFEQESAK